MGEEANGFPAAWTPAPRVSAGTKGWNWPREHPWPRAGARAARTAASVQISCSAAVGPFPFHPSQPITPFSLFPTAMCFSLGFACN